MLMLMLMMMMLMMMREEKEKEKDMLREKSNNPNLKGGEKHKKERGAEGTKKRKYYSAI